MMPFKSNKLLSILHSFIKGVSDSGVGHILLINNIIANYIISFLKSGYFYFNKKKLRYFYHPYNHTWVNERAVEVPIILELMKNHKNILEVGNVLQNYFKTSHDVLDKYDYGPGVINEDVLSFNPSKKYDLILSISTLEHVGWDEAKKDASKIPRSLDNLKKCLKSGGVMIITVPIGYNDFLDKIISNHKEFDEAYFLRRGIFNTWKQVNYSEVAGIHFLKNISAVGLAILVIKKS